MLALAAVVLVLAAPSSEVQVRHTGYDSAGRFAVEVKWPNQPWILPANGADIEEYHVIRMPAGEVCKVWTFLGVDRGDLVEAHINVVAGTGGTPLVLRSEHHEAPGKYDAWKSEKTKWSSTGPFDIGISLLGRATASRNARVHFGLYVVMAPLGACE